MENVEDALLVLRSPAEAQAFLEMILTKRERAWVRGRWGTLVAKARGVQGESGTPTSVRQIGAEVHVSPTTVVRGSRSIEEYAELMRTLVERLQKQAAQSGGA
jgi:Trp operon repressor